MNRPKFVSRSILLRGEQQRATAAAMLANLPCDPDHPLEIVAREPVKARGLDANARMWVGPLRDLAEQGYIDGKSFSDEVWHEHCKREFLPDETMISPEELATLVKEPEAYRKWGFTPRGNKVLLGSTTQLTRRGFALYTKQIVLLGESLGVQFSASPNEAREHH